MMFSLVLPAYNESENIESTVNSVRKELKKIKKISYEIIIAEDGSNDGTDEIARKLQKKFKEVRHLHSDEKLGRGRALKQAFEKAKGEIVGYLDVDLAVGPEYLPKLITLSMKNDLVTGSRYLKESEVERPSLREFVSRSYNWMIRFFLGCDVKDSQCGFKGFSRRIVKDIVNEVEENSWAWDTVVIVECIKSGYKFKEFPVNWEEKKEAAHSSSFKRIYSDIKIHGSVILKLFLKWKMGIKIQV